MKKLLSIVALVALLLPVAAHAQTPIYGPVTLGSFVNLAQAATNVGYVIDCRKQESVVLGFANLMSTSATDNQTIVFSRSIDGVNYGTTLYAIALAPTASTASLQLTNIHTLGAGYIKINYVTNAAATGIATNTLTYAVKISAP